MTAPITPTPPPSPEALKASFGFVGALAGAIPELKAILDQAVREQWTSDRFIMAVSGSGWYRENSDKARELITLQNVDPATAEANIVRQAGEMWTFAHSQGVMVNDMQAREIAMWRMLNPTASDDLVKTHIVRNYFNSFQDWTQLGGQAAAIAGQIQQIGRAYGWDDFSNEVGQQDSAHYQESRDWLYRIMEGGDTIDGFKRRMIDYAKVKYPGLHDQLQAGMTVQQIAQPYMDSMSKVLEMPQTAINWYEDPLISQAMQTSTPGKQEQSAGTMPIYEFEKKLRQDPRWAKTQNARDKTAQLVTQIGRDFGYVG